MDYNVCINKIFTRGKDIKKMDNEDNIVGTLVAILMVFIIILIIGTFYRLADENHKNIREARNEARVYLRDNNIENAPITNITANQGSKTKKKTEGLDFVFESVTESGTSQKTYFVSNVEYKKGGKVKTLSLGAPDDEYIDVQSKGTLTYLAPGKQPRLTVKTYQDKEESKEEHKFVLRREVHLYIPKDYNFSQSFEFGE